MNVVEQLKQAMADIPLRRALLVNSKAIVSGGMVEIWTYEKPIAKFLSKKPSARGTPSTATPEERTEIAKQNALESYNNFIRLVVANFSTCKTKFLTLTFENTDSFDITDVKQCNEKFKEFIQRLRWKYGKDFKYIATVEYQDKNNRGAIHYHVMLDIPYVKAKILNEIWSYGNINIKAVKDAKHSAVYCGKYMRKGLIDERLIGKKKYHGSKNLRKPKEVYNDNVDDLLKQCQGKEKYSENSYFSEYHDATIYYSKYFLDHAELPTQADQTIAL